MKPAAFTYHRAHSAEHALELLANLEDAVILAGGQSLVPMLNLRLANPANVIDIHAMTELSFMDTREQGLFIGAATTQRSIEHSKLVREQLPLLAEAVQYVGHPQIRSRGTVGGSLCHLDPAAQIPLVAMALDATVVVGRQQERRQLPFSEFALGSMTTALDPDEMLLEVCFQPWAAGAGWGYAQYARRQGDFSILSAAVMLLANADGDIERISVCVGGAQDCPVRLKSLEDHATGGNTSSGMQTAASEACEQLEMLDDAFVPGWYRKKVAPVIIERAYNQAVSRTRASVHATAD